MDGKTYLAIFKENGLYRSEIVKLLENQIKVLSENGMHDLAEETKWLAIVIAEQEKEQGYPFLEE